MNNATGFDVLFTETISEILRNVFEDETSKIIMDYLEKNSLEKNAYEKAKALADILPKILGVGSAIIEDLAIETLHTKCGLVLERKKDFKFADYVANLCTRVQELKG
jgi:hypothetical protein